MANFQDILDKPASQIETPRALAVGTYLCIVDGQPELAVIGKNNTDCLNFRLKPMQAQPDVDPTALAESLNGASLQDRIIRHRLFLTEQAEWRLKKFLENDLAIEVGSKTLREMVAEAMGRQVLVTVGHRPSDDGTQIYTDVKNTARV